MIACFRQSRTRVYRAGKRPAGGAGAVRVVVDDTGGRLGAVCFPPPPEQAARTSATRIGAARLTPVLLEMEPRDLLVDGVSPSHLTQA